MICLLSDGRGVAHCPNPFGRRQAAANEQGHSASPAARFLAVFAPTKPTIHNPRVLGIASRVWVAGMPVARQLYTRFAEVAGNVALRAPDLNEGTWLGATIAVGGLLCGIVSVAAIMWNNAVILLAIAAGAGWALSIVFAALYASRRREMGHRIVALETELAAARNQAAEWSATSNNISMAARAVLDLAGSAPAAPRRRSRPKAADQEG